LAANAGGARAQAIEAPISANTNVTNLQKDRMPYLPGAAGAPDKVGATPSYEARFHNVAQHHDET
jgi:hypothetical protein